MDCRKPLYIRTVMKMFCWVFLSLFPVLAFAQDYRQKVTMDPDRAYLSMFNSLKSDRYRQISTVFANLESLTEELGNKENVDFNSEMVSALKNGDHDQVVYLLLRIISSDINDRLSYLPAELETKKYSRAKRRIRMTFTTYLLMIPYVKENPSVKSWDVKLKFKNVVSVVETSARLKTDQRQEAIETMKGDIGAIADALRLSVGNQAYFRFKTAAEVLAVK